MARAVDADEEQPILTVAKYEEHQERENSSKRLYLVEPVIFLYNLATFGFSTLNTEYLYHRVETNVFAEIESVNETREMTGTLDAAISTKASDWALTINLAGGLPSLFSSLAVLALTDIYGRKLGLLLPTLGGLIQMIGYSLIEAYNLDIGYLFIPNVINGFSGFSQCLIGAGYLYVGDVASLKSRSLRFVFIQVCVTVAVTVANAVMGELINYLSWYNCFLVVGGVYLITCLWILVLLPESRNFANTSHIPQGKWSWIVDSATAFKVYVTPRTERTARPLLIAMGAVVAINALLSFGSGSLCTLYLLGRPFHYDSVTIGDFLSEQGAIFCVGPLLIVPVLLLCDFTDLGIILCGLISGGLTYTVLGMAASKTAIYLSPLFGVLLGAICAVPRSLMSKIVSEDEQCALQATVSSLNSLGELASNTILVAIYGVTVSFFSGFTYTLIGLIYFLLFFMVSIFWCIAKKEPQSSPT